MQFAGQWPWEIRGAWAVRLAATGEDRYLGGMADGWVIGVLVQPPGEPAPLRHYFAVGHQDQAKCEWTAVDYAGRAGIVASSPLKGQEPVEAIRPLTLAKMKSFGLLPGQVRELGWRHPRRWLTG